MPKIAVVVSAYNRADLVPELVAALKAQTCDDFEAVLVDNGSTDDTHAVLESQTAEDPRFRVLRVEGNRGPARARNEAWRTARADLVAFTDDDCSPTPTWLDAMLRAAERADVIQGRTTQGDHPPGVRPSWFDRSKNVRRFNGRYETCNLGVRRSYLDRLDGFDEQFPVAMGEDTDFGLRAVAAGARTAFADDALVIHHLWPGSFREFLRQRRRYSEVVQLMRANPGARGLLLGRYILRPNHVVYWFLVPATIASVLLGAWWVTPAFIGAWIVRNTIRDAHRGFSVPRRLWFSALQVVGYAYETWCFAVASVRYRALVI